MNEVGFHRTEVSLGQVKALDCGNSLGPILAKNSRKTGEKSRFFPWAGVENPWRGSKIPIQTAGPHTKANGPVRIFIFRSGQPVAIGPAGCLETCAKCVTSLETRSNHVHITKLRSKSETNQRGNKKTKET